MIAWMAALSLAGTAWWALWRFRIRPCWMSEAPEAVAGPERMPRLSLIVPARNEADRLPRLLHCLATEGPSDMEVIVVDDHSIDGTSACVREAARLDRRVRLVCAAPKPTTWSGKNWAIHQGVAKATGDWLVFCDADVRLMPGSLDRAMGLIEREALDALALIAGMDVAGRASAMLVACFALSRAVLFRPAAPRRRGLVQGAFFAVRGTAYAAVGGHESDKQSLLEDVALGYRLHAAGFRVRAYPARRWIRVGMYATFDEMHRGFQKHMFPAIGFSSLRLVFVVALHLFLFLFPFASVLIALHRLFENGATPAGFVALMLSGAACGSMYWVALKMMRAESLPRLGAWAAPIAYFWMGSALSASVSGYRNGSIAWKGRDYGTRDENTVGLE